MDEWLQLFARANFVRSADTAHDLKTPLNIAVLNLELLRMRIRKITGTDDEKLTEYTRALEMELRRMARIFDTFFLLSTPPRSEGAPAPIDLGPLVSHAAGEAGYTAEPASGKVIAHQSRIEQALQMFFEGASRVLKAERRSLSVSKNDSRFKIVITGEPEAADFELTKIFKFYYTDPAGEPDLSLATARLILETYGGELFASQESDKVNLRLSLPLGDR